MCKMDSTVGKWFGVLNNMGRDIAYHARDEYDTFLNKCLEPYGINKVNATENAERVAIEEESPHIEGFESVTYQRFYIDGKYEFTVVMKQGPTVSGMHSTGFQFTYEAVVEQDRVPKKEPMTNDEAIKILETARGICADKDEDEAFDKAIAALERNKSVGHFVIFTKEDIDNLRNGKWVEDVVYDTTYMTEDTYEKYLIEKKEEPE